MTSGHTAACSDFHSWHFSATHSISEDSRPHGLGIASATAGCSSHVTPTVLAETLSSVPRLTPRVLMHQACVTGLCHSPGPLEGPLLVGAGCGFRNGVQEESHLYGCFQNRLGSPMQWQSSFSYLVERRKRATHQLAVCRALQTFLPLLAGHHILVRSDSMTGVHKSPGP